MNFPKPNWMWFLGPIGPLWSFAFQKSEPDSDLDSGTGFLDSIFNKFLIFIAVVFFIYKFLKRRNYV